CRVGGRVVRLGGLCGGGGAAPWGRRAGARTTSVNAAMGQAGMPDPIRIAVEGFGAHPQYKARARARAGARDGGLRAAGAIVLSGLIPCGRACAEAASARFEFPAFEAYISALP